MTNGFHPVKRAKKKAAGKKKAKPKRASSRKILTKSLQG